MDPNIDDYQFVMRKRKNKKKNAQRKVKPGEIETVDEDTLVNTARGVNINDDSDGEEGNTSDDAVRVVETCDQDANSRITTDAMPSAAPKYDIPTEKIETKETPSSDLETKEEPTSIPEEINTQFNSRPLLKEASTYQLETFEKNALIIFNQDKIDGWKPRLGTQRDVDALKATFGRFGFEVFDHTDLTKEQIFTELKAFSETDFTNYGCVAVTVLTHGTDNGLLRAKDQLYSEHEILSYFKTHDKPYLVTKPKILIIQACRGTRCVAGVPVMKSGKIRKDQDEVDHYYLPVESDMLVLHSSYAGNPSHRDELLGSWLIQSLCRKVNELAPAHDFETILTEVKREVAIDRYVKEYNRRTFEQDINKQMPVTTSTLIRKLYLKKFGDEPPPSLELTRNVPQPSCNEVLDAMPNTPLQLQFGPCSCFLDHFDYMRNCLRHFVEENRQDEAARSFLDVAETFEGPGFNAPKERMLKAICNHLMIHSRDRQYFKFLHFYKT